MSSYQYTSLDSGTLQIRLLTIEPNLDSTAMIKCSLQIHELKEAPEYQALSYCWGDPDDTRPIELEGFEFCVTVNLSHALQRLRRPDSPVVFWIDALCIDQRNIPERNDQVRQMGEIFSSASLVIIWLGEAEPDSDLAFELVRCWNSDSHWDVIHNPEKFEREFPNAFDEEPWAAMRKIFERQWWDRIWTYQEYVLASRVLFMCGNSTMEELELSCAVLLWYEASRAASLSLTITQASYIAQVVNARFLRLSNHRRYCHKPAAERIPDRLDLFTLQHRTHGYDSTDPRDKIYALLGVDEIGDIKIEVDYAKPVEEVYLQFTVDCIRNQNSLAILSHIGVSHVSTEKPLIGPSWVPDLRASAIRYVPAEAMPPVADGNILPRFSFANLGKELVCEGLIFDVVTESQECLREYPGIVMSVGDQITSKAGLHPSGIPQAQAFFRTMLLDMSSSGPNGTDFQSTSNELEWFQMALGFIYLHGTGAITRDNEHAYLAREIVTALVPLVYSNEHAVAYAWFANEPTLLLDGTPEEQLLTSFLGEADATPRLKWPASSFLDALQDANAKVLSFRYIRQGTINTRNRTFFGTSKGYFGLGPLDVHVEDKVCIIFGCPYPLILRPGTQGTCYRVVGPCYVYGLMHGEAVKEMEAGNMTQTTFHLI